MPGGNYGYHPRRPGPDPLARGAARRRAEDPAHLLRLADRHVRLRGHAAAEEVLGPTAAHRRRPAPRALLPPDAERGRLRRGPRGHGDAAPTTGSGRRTFAWRRTAACSSPTGTIPASAATAWATATRGRIYRLAPKGHKGYKRAEGGLDEQGRHSGGAGFAELWRCVTWRWQQIVNTSWTSRGLGRQSVCWRPSMAIRKGSHI